MASSQMMGARVLHRLPSRLATTAPMGPTFQLLRTLTAGAIPALVEGELCLDLGSTPIALWVGVPTSVDPNGKVQLLPSTGTTPPPATTGGATVGLGGGVEIGLGGGATVGLGGEGTTSTTGAGGATAGLGGGAEAGLGGGATVGLGGETAALRQQISELETRLTALEGTK